MPFKKEIRKIDTNLFSGSSDTLRTALGMYYMITSSFDNNGNNIGSELSSSLPIISQKVAGGLSGVNAYEIINNVIKYSQINKYKLEETQTGPVKRYRIPVRIIGDESKITNSTEWETMLQGGIFGTASYQKMFSANTYDVYNHFYETSYTELQKKQILNVASNQSIDLSTFNIGYDYQLYLPEYQNNIASKNIKELPNMYFNEIYSLAINNGTSSAGFALLKDISDFVTRAGTYNYGARDLHAVKEDQLSETPPPFRLKIGSTSEGRNTENTRYQDESLFLRQYLTGAYLLNDISEQTKQDLIEKTQVLFFTDFANQDVLNALQESGPKDVYTRYPMQANLKIPLLTTSTGITMPGDGSYTKIISDNNLQEEVLSYIKTSFQGAGALGGGPEIVQFARQSTQLVPNTAELKISQQIETATITDSMIDVPDMLLDIAKNPDVTQAPNELFITPDADELSAMANLNSSFRYTKTINGMQALQSTLTKMNSSIDESFKDELLENYGDDFFKILNDTKDINNSPEVIAYRIEKIAGPPIGDSQQRTKIQDVYFFNNGLSFDGENINYYDTQVKYGEEYTYSVYAYMLVPGIRYRYSDLRISRYTGEALKIVGAPGSDQFVLDADEPHCVEFFDPNSGAPTPQLLNHDTNLLSNKPQAPQITEEMVAAYDAAGTAADKRMSSGRFTQIAVFKEAFLEERNTGNDEAQIMFDYIYSSSSSAYSLARFIEKLLEFSLKYHEYYLEEDIEYGSGDDNVVVQGGQMIQFAHFAKNRYATNAQIKSANKYLADFYYEIEPSLKIIQVPITSKYFTVMDHPPVACDVIPFQRKDNSQIIGFQINRETFPINKYTDKIFNNDSLFGLYPTPISTQEQQLKSNYLQSNNMLPNEMITKPSVSPPARVDIYRLNKLPTSLTDFNDNLVFSVNLQYEEDIYYNYSNCLYEEMIATNQKYYYLFKFVNENGMPGYVSPVQVAELIDDGGYKYAKFDVIFENELKIPNPIQPSLDFKKLIQIAPASRHTEIVDQTLSQNLNPHELINNNQVPVGYASDPIWNKKFKFRLTSKKTGKKLDFNITYKLRNS